MEETLIKSDKQIISDLEARILKARVQFAGSKHESIVDKAMSLFYTSFLQCEYEEVEKELAKLPTEEQLLNELVLKLKNKSVFKTIVQIQEGKVKHNATYMKALFSLGTHAAIEIEKGHAEYRMLVTRIYEKIGEVVYAGV
jgi:hypothetical protein